MQSGAELAMGHPGLRFQRLKNFVPVLDEEFLARIETVQQVSRRCYVVAATRKPINPVLLFSNPSFTLDDVPLRLLQMAKMHHAISKPKAAGHGTAPCQAGAQSVSQPPTPGKALAGDAGERL